MSAHTFKIIFDDLFSETHEIVDSAIYNQTSDAEGRWTTENEGNNIIWKLISEKAIVGASGALLIRPRNNPDGLCHMVAFGYWQRNNKPWFGAVADLDSWDGGDALSKFYGHGEYEKEGVYWTQDTRGFKVNGRVSNEEISFVSSENFQTGTLDVRVLIMRVWN